MSEFALPSHLSSISVIELVGNLCYIYLDEEYIVMKFLTAHFQIRTVVHIILFVQIGALRPSMLVVTRQRHVITMFAMMDDYTDHLVCADGVGCGPPIPP